MCPSSVAAAPTPAICRFGRFELRPGERLLLADGVPVPVGARAFDLLVVLSERAGSLVTKRELLEKVWPGLVVEENNLQVQVSQLRKLLGQGAVATIPGRGYRFGFPVARAETAGPPPASEEIGATTAEARPRARTNLPSRSLALFGRADDLAAIHALVARHCVVTVVGAGGIGKTRVAQAVATELAHDQASAFPDGVWWVELAALTDPDLVPSTVAKSLGLQLPGGRSDAEALKTLIADQTLFVVLDNCEHLADSVAAFVDGVVAHAPGVRMLITSQETLKAADEHVYRLGALAVPDDSATGTGLLSGAVELFVARAAAADPRFALTQANAPAVVEICRRLDGIPLAIELAAARVPLLGVEGLRSRLDERFNVLTGGSRVVLRRHQTLRATLEWSHGLLTGPEQTVFRRLGVFAGGFTLEAAQYVASESCIDPWTALEHLGALVDKSLVLAEGDPIPRYRMLETTRAYAVEHLAESGETKSTLRRHAEALVEWLSPIGKHAGTPESPRFGEAAAELDNIRAALTWATSADSTPDLALRLAAGSYPVWRAGAQLAEGFERCRALAGHLADAPADLAAAYWLTVAQLGLYSLRPEAYEAARRAVDLYRAQGSDARLELYEALTCAATVGLRFATPEAMEAAVAEAEAIERPEWPARTRSALQFARYRLCQRLGRPDEALACAERQVAIAHEGGHTLGAHYAISNVTAALIELGQPERALSVARNSIAELESLGGGSGAGHLYNNVMSALLLLGRVDEGMAAGRKAYALLRSEGDQIRVFTPLALGAAMQARFEDAGRVLGFALAEVARAGALFGTMRFCVRERLEGLLASTLEETAYRRLLGEGAVLTEEQARRAGFGE